MCYRHTTVRGPWPMPPNAAASATRSVSPPHSSGCCFTRPRSKTAPRTDMADKFPHTLPGLERADVVGLKDMAFAATEAEVVMKTRKPKIKIIPLIHGLGTYSDGHDLFLVVLNSGERVAKRAETGSWIALDPTYEIFNDPAGFPMFRRR